MKRIRESFLIVLSGFVGAMAQRYYEKYLDNPFVMLLLIFGLLFTVIISLILYDKFIEKFFRQ